MDVFFTTVVRGAPVSEGGEIVRLDWDSKKVLARNRMPPRDVGIVDPNPRGNARGGKGIAVVGNEVIAASYHTLHVFNRRLEEVRQISANQFASLHEVHYEADGRLWVSATAIDAALAVDLQTGSVVREFWPREMPQFQQAFGLFPLEIDKAADNRIRFLHFEKNSHLHLNAVAIWRGDVYALFNSCGAVVNLSQGRVVVRDQRIARGHNLCFADDGTIVVNDTRGHSIRMYDLQTGEQTQEISLTQYPWVRRVRAWHMRTRGIRKFLGRFGVRRLARSKLLFVRGLQVCGDSLFVGASPAMILHIDRHSGALIDAYSYSRNPDCCVHGLWVDHHPTDPSRPGNRG